MKPLFLNQHVIDWAQYRAVVSMPWFARHRLRGQSFVRADDFTQRYLDEQERQVNEGWTKADDEAEAFKEFLRIAGSRKGRPLG